MTNPSVLSVASAVPPHRVSQDEAKKFANALFSETHRDLGRLMPLFDNVAVEGRNFCVPYEWFERDHAFPERNALYVEKAKKAAPAKEGEAKDGAPAAKPAKKGA